MHQGYFIEQELKTEALSYPNLEEIEQDEAGFLQKRVKYVTRKIHYSEEDMIIQKPEDTISVSSWDVQIWSALIDSLLNKLRIGIKEYAQYECKGCGIDHPSRYDMCSNPVEWVKDLKYHVPVLECLNIYDVLKEWNYRVGLCNLQRRKSGCLDILEKSEAVQAYHNWELIKRNQYCLPMKQQWKDYWEVKLLEDLAKHHAILVPTLLKIERDSLEVYIKRQDLSEKVFTIWTSNCQHITNMDCADATCVRSGMECYERRLETFDTYPKQMLPNKYQLAKAGFYYTKEADIVICFRCAVKVKSWERDDDAMKEHQKWSPNCGYLRMVGTDLPMTGGVWPTGYGFGSTTRSSLFVKQIPPMNVT